MPRLQLMMLIGSVLASAPAARAALMMQCQEIGGNVVITASGKINTSALTTAVAISSSGGVNPDTAFITMRSGSGTAYAGASGPASFGSFTLSTPSSSSGDFVGIRGNVPYIYLPSGYGGTPLSATSTYNGKTLASMGFLPTPFIFTYTWGAGATADSLIVTSLPEPGAMALLCVAAGGMLRRRRVNR